jgi:hypothetical protein
MLPFRTARFCRGVCAWMAFAAAALTSAVSADAQSSGERTDVLDAGAARDYLLAAIDYGRAWNTGDVLVRLRHGLDSVDSAGKEVDFSGVLVERTEYWRVVFDLSKGQLCALRHLHQSALDLSKQGDGLDPRQERMELYGASIDENDRLVRRNFPGTLVNMAKVFGPAHPKPEEFARRAEITAFPDFRAFFCGGGMMSDSIQVAEDVIRIRGSDVWRFDRSRTLGDGTAEFSFVYTEDWGSGQWSKTIETWTVDPGELVPLGRHYRHLSSDPSQSRQGERVEYEWQAIKGIQVLRSYRSHDDRGRANFLLDRPTGLLDVEADFHWFSLNDQVDSRYFDGSLMKDQDTMLSVLDPGRCGATTLVSPDDKPLTFTGRRTGGGR